ncbi:outer membrane protein [Glaciecola sp. MH2013]|uniref:outer membrane protein n=1 Tax=Glaciecola sp. MH2013 TaxID=2785524 RepID=UPI001E2C170C|nr:porin [Glaciecola sp. MH2013]
MKINKKLSIVAVAVLATFQAQADIRINGFANLTTGITTEDTNLFGTTEDIDFSNDSLFAIQFSGDISDKWMATAQVIARGSNDYSAEFEWAYLTYTASDNSEIIAGRFRLPVFRYSASLDVGYSYHWIEAPQTVYDVAFNNINGIRYDYTNYSGDFEYVLQFSYGNYEDEIGGGINKAKDVVLASFEGNMSNIKGRIVWGRGENQFSQGALDAALASISEISPVLADELAIDGDEGVFLGFGLEYDNFDWFVSAEYTTIDIEDSFSPKDTAYYVTAGTRLGKFTPHITYQERDGRGDVRFQESVNVLPEPFRTVVTGINAGLQSSFFEEYSMITVGMRYDIATNVALKAEYTSYDNKIDVAEANPEDAVDTDVIKFSVNYVF